MTTPRRRSTVRPFPRRGVYWARIPRLGARAVQRSLGTRSVEVARAMGAFLWTLRDRRESWLLDQIAAGAIPVGAAYDAFRQQRLEEFIAAARDRRDDPDLEPHVAKWAASMVARGRPGRATSEKYVRQVRTLVREGVAFPRSAITRARIAEWLDGLTTRATGRPVAQPNRHRAALSAFCAYLVERDMLPANPVRAVRAASEHVPRCRYLSDAETWAVLDALEEPYRTAHALMAGTGMEISTVIALRRRDVSQDAHGWVLRAQGTKRISRDRVVRITDPRCEALVLARARPLLPGAAVFPGLTDRNAREALQRACRAVGISEYRTHDWRHTYALRELRRGLPLSTIAHQLGHRNTMMVQRVYGRFTVEASDYAPRLLRDNATLPVSERQNGRV